MSQQMHENQFLQAYQDFADALFRHCYFKTSNRDLAQDLVQEIFKKAWLYVSEGKEIREMRPFLYRIANNLIVDEFRRKKAIVLENVEDVVDKQVLHKMAGNPERIAQGNEAVALLARLDGSYREALTMRFIDGFAVKEIAEVVGESENVISVRIHRGLKQLKALLL